jgi:hypothetical protein
MFTPTADDIADAIRTCSACFQASFDKVVAELLRRGFRAGEIGSGIASTNDVIYWDIVSDMLMDFRPIIVKGL